MIINRILEGDRLEDLITKILSNIHLNGPVASPDFESLALIKKHQPDIFNEYESRLMSVMGLFYKTEEPKNLLEEVYSIFSDSIYESTGKKFTPVQADAYSRILKQKYFSFSAPTSAGKSHLFRELINDIQDDILIIVPSRALISEYIHTVSKLVDKETLVLQFIENINIKHTKRRIYIITPERGDELFKNISELNVSLVLFDEAQLSEEEYRGLKFDSFVRRVDRAIPKAKKVFTHPFVENPEAQLNKHDFTSNSEAMLYKQNSVGKIFQIINDQGFHYFSPYEQVTPKTTLKVDYDIIAETIKENRSVLIYTSKTKIYDGSFLTDFHKYIDLCPKLTSKEALGYVKKLKEFIGASDADGDKRSLMLELMERGIVIHHGSMPLKARLLIEEFVNNNFSRICFSTSTLTQGINMPFDIVWINNFRFRGSPNQKIIDLKNLIGRAGRSTSEKDSFDYGYVIIEEKNLDLFCERISGNATLSNESNLDNDEQTISEDLLDIVEAIKEDTFNDEYQLTEKQVERIDSSDLESLIEFTLDNLLKNNLPITGKDYYQLTDYKRKKIKSSFKEIYISHLRRKKLNDAESGILSASIPIMLWQIQGKSFSEIVTLRHAFLSEKDERRRILSEVKNGNLTNEEGAELIEKIKIRFTPIASGIPNSNLRQAPLFPRNSSVNRIEYDILVYDTYDFTDKVISLSLRDPISAAYSLYYKQKGDDRALIISNYIRYGTNDPIEIWLVKYGFSFDDIEWIKPLVVSIDEQEIIFDNNISQLEKEKYEIIERYVYE